MAASLISVIVDVFTFSVVETNDTFIVHPYLFVYTKRSTYLPVNRTGRRKKFAVRGDDSSDFSYLMIKRREPSSMIVPFIIKIRSKGSLIEFRATGHFVSSLTFSLTDSLLGGRQKKKKIRKVSVIHARKSFLDSNDSYRSQKRD